MIDEAHVATSLSSRVARAACSLNDNCESMTPFLLLGCGPGNNIPSVHQDTYLSWCHFFNNTQDACRLHSTSV